MIADPPETAKPEAPDAARATDYLTTLVPNGRLAVAAILPTSQITGRTFTLPAERDGLRVWIAERIDSANLYLTLNEPVEPERQVGKGGRVAAADIRSIRGIIVDLDPDKVAEQLPGGFEAERARLRDVVDLLQSHFVCEPAAVVDTGGGYQLTYLFPAPLPATPENVAGVVAQARGLAKAFGGDATHDVAHLFRIPHTRNLPNAAKRARGRAEAITTLIAMPMVRAPLEALPLVAPPIATPAPTEAAAAFDCDEARAYLGAPEDLPAPVQMKLATAAAGSQALRRALNSDLAAEHFSDRSGRDFAIAVALREDGGFTKLEAACVIAAYSPDKTEDRGAAYLARTVQSAWQRAKPTASAADYFDAAAAAAAAAGAPLASGGGTVDRPAGLVSVSGLIDPQTIPPRDYLIFPRLPLGIFSMLVGEPAISKSTLMLRDAIVVATGREHILRGDGNVSPERLHRVGPVIVYNAEDDPDEMRGRLRAMQSHFGITAADMRHEIHLWSGTQEPLVLMRREAARGPLLRAPGADQLANLVRQTRAVLVVLDPFVSLFAGADENDTGDMDRASTLLTTEATRLRIGLSVAHHTAKSTRDHAGDQGAGRGAFSIVAKARSQATLCAVDPADAKQWGVEGRDVIRLDTGKSSYGKRNRAPILLERLSVEIGNKVQALDPVDPSLTAAGQEFRMRGGSAPVLVALKMGTQERALAEAKAEKQDHKRAAIAQAACDVLGDRSSAPLSQVLHEICKKLQDANVTTANGRDAITNLVKTALAGDGVPVDRSGQIVRVRIFQNGAGATAPWTIEALQADAQPSFRAFLENANTEGSEA